MCFSSIQINKSSLFESTTTNKRDIKIRSNSLQTLGAGLFPPPNTINFKAVFSNFAERLLDSPVVLAIMLTLVIIYIPLLIWMRRKDKRDQLKVASPYIRCTTYKTHNIDI